MPARAGMCAHTCSRILEGVAYDYAGDTFVRHWIFVVVDHYFAGSGGGESSGRRLGPLTEKRNRGNFDWPAGEGGTS